MNKLVFVLCLMSLSGTTRAQTFPPFTEEGKKAANRLLDACKDAGALKEVMDPRTKTQVLVVADSKKLADALKQHRDLFTPRARDALLRVQPRSLAAALLVQGGQQTGDRQAIAFGRLFEAEAAQRRRTFREARQGYDEAARLFAELKLGDWQAVALSNLAEICRAQGDLPQARTLHQNALDLLRKSHGEKHPEVATSLNNLALVYYAQRDLVQARKLCEQALALRKDLHGENHLNVANSLSGLGGICRAQGDLSRARSSLQQALEILTQLYGEKHPYVGLCLSQLAEVLHDQEDLPQARKLCQKVLDLQRQLQNESDPVVTAKALNQLALVCRDQGDLSQARALLQQAHELTRTLHGERHSFFATSLINLATVCRDQGDLPQARKLFQKAADLLEQLHGRRHPEVAKAMNGLAVVRIDQGELTQARKLLQQVLDILKETLGEKHPYFSACLNNLAEVHALEGDLTQARNLFQQSLDLSRKFLGERHPNVGIALNNLAMVYGKLGNPTRADELLQQSLQLRKRVFGEKHPAVATCLNNLALVCLDRRDLPRAEQYFTEAILAHRLPQARDTALLDLGPESLTVHPLTVKHLNKAGSLLGLSGQQLDLAQARRAAHVCGLAASLLDRLRSESLQSEDSKLSHGVEHAPLVPLRIRLAHTLFDLGGTTAELHTAFTALEQGRARIFLQSFGEARARHIGGIPPLLQEQERDFLDHLRGIDARIDKENSKTADRRDDDLMRKLHEERKEKEAGLEKFVSRLREDYPQFAALLHPRPCSLQQARDCLGDREVAVLFALQKKASWAVVLHKKPAADDKREGVHIVKLPGEEVVANKVRTLIEREVLRNDSRTRHLGGELYDLLLKPLAEHLQGKDLLLAPDGVLWELPFELLVEGRTEESDGNYLIERRHIRYTPSMTVLHLIGQWEKSRQAPAEALWALGDPVFSTDDPRAKGTLHSDTWNLLERYALRQRGGQSWDRLPATRREVEAIARLHRLDEDDVVTDLFASEKVIKTVSQQGVLARKRHVHLATHGILGSARGRQPSLVLSLVGNKGETQLGGVNDGFLTLEEVTHLKLNADLVVLSACETGKGDLQPAEGVIGLSRAFLYAGSRGVVCSLWQVDDEQTSRLMQSLYTNLQEGKSSAEALALARRKLIAEEVAPLYWAPFILIGK